MLTLLHDWRRDLDCNTIQFLPARVAEYMLLLLSLTLRDDLRLSALPSALTPLLLHWDTALDIPALLALRPSLLLLLRPSTRARAVLAVDLLHDLHTCLPNLILRFLILL